MDRLSFRQICQQLEQMSRDQLVRLARGALLLARSGRAAELIEAARAPHLGCPRCCNTKLYRDGQANGLQRFRCRDCGRTFNSLTKTPLARLRLKDKWLAYCDKLFDPATTVRRAAEQVGVHRSTSFRWRHRMLAWPRLDHQTPLQGIVEADEMYVRESFKGVRDVFRAAGRPARKRGGPAGKRGISNEQICVLVARDRCGRTYDAVTGNGQLTVARLNHYLAPVLAADVTLMTDAHAAYGGFARQHGIAHQSINAGAGERARGATHIQHVNAYHSRLRGWLYHFRGVATRYLPNYCGWRRAIDAPRIDSAEAFLRAAVGVFRT